MILLLRNRCFGSVRAGLQYNSKGKIPDVGATKHKYQQLHQKDMSHLFGSNYNYMIYSKVDYS